MEGLSKTRLYTIFSGMKQRCYNTNTEQYKFYGAKGIFICNEWMSENGLQAFMTWALDNGYEEHLTIDRIDPKGPYSPANCRWITRSENSSRAHKFFCTLPLTMGEKIKVLIDRRGITITELAKRLGTSRQNMTNKFARDDFSEKELKSIAEKLGCEFIGAFKMNDTGEVI